MPLIVRRVRSDEKANGVAAEQLLTPLQDEQMPFHRQLCIHVSNNAYSTVEYLGQVGNLPNLVTVARAVQDRVFYRFGTQRLLIAVFHPPMRSTLINQSKNLLTFADFCCNMVSVPGKRYHIPVL